jgi:hypothetical protein
MNAGSNQLDLCVLLQCIDEEINVRIRHKTVFISMTLFVFQY